MHGAHACVAGGPAFARAGVGRLAEGAEGGTVHPGVGEGVLGLEFGQTEEPGGDGGGGDFDQHGVVEANLVEGVGDLETALDFVRFHERYENRVDCQRLLAPSE